MNKKRIAEETDKINKKKVSNPGLLSTKWNSSLHSYQVPDRNYWLDFVYVSAIPAFILIVLGAFLVYIFYEIDETSHEVRSGHENRPAMEEDLAQYASPEPLRSLSLLRDIPDTPSRASPAPSSHKFRPDPPPYSQLT
uniref:Transmembrane protein n=2 Tax=Cacopsylla melanoneura TaxID=428564 RepID=A0A8D9ERV0_9HEMI